MDLVTVTRHGGEHAGVTEITLSRPAALNALSADRGRQLAAACAQVAGDSSGAARAVVLSAAGDRAFCVGADLKERNAMSDQEIMAQRMVFRGVFGAVL